MNVLNICSIILLLQCCAYASQDSIKDVQRVSYGASILPSLSLHRATMLPPKPMSICCPIFTEGKGWGFDASLFAKYVIDYNHSFGASFGYRDISAVFSTETMGILNSKNEIGIVRSMLETHLSILHVQLLYAFMPIHRLELTLGVSVGVNASKNYSYQENVISGNQLFDNGTQQRNSSMGALTGINPRYFGLVFGSSYRIPILNSTFYLVPQFRFTHALRPIQFGTHWFADAITAGVGIEYFPFGEIQKPKKLSSIQHESIQHDTNGETSCSLRTTIIPGSFNIYPQVHYVPFLDIVYPDIILRTENKTNSPSECNDDRGSCHYPYMMDTLSTRMQKMTHPERMIELSQGIDSISQQNLNVLANLKKIDTTLLRLSISKDPSIQNAFKIKNDNLLNPYQIVSNDTVMTSPTIIWKCESQFPLEFEWAFLNLNTEQVVRKGKSISNTDITIDSIPIDCNSGLIRMIIHSGDTKKVYQTECTVPVPNILRHEPYTREMAVLFEKNGYDLRTIDIKTIKMFNEAVTDSDTIVIEAFTDLSGDIELNANLAKRRAESVAVLLPGVPKEIILSPLKSRNSGRYDYQKAYNRIVTIKRK